MTSPALLQSYRAVREVLGDIQWVTSAVDEHVGRFQIYGAEEELNRAMVQTDELVAKVEELGLQLRRLLSGAQSERCPPHAFHSYAFSPSATAASLNSRD
jgi:hypothetical protein